jgi:hypothetical protein
MIYIALNRRLIWPERFVHERPPWASPQRPPRKRPRSPALAETPAKPAATVSAVVSGIRTLDNDAEMVALRTLAKLIQAELITETVGLQTVFAVKAGSSKRYKEVQAKLKAAQAELESAAELAG